MAGLFARAMDISISLRLNRRDFAPALVADFSDHPMGGGQPATLLNSAAFLACSADARGASDHRLDLHRAASRAGRYRAQACIHVTFRNSPINSERFPDFARSRGPTAEGTDRGIMSSGVRPDVLFEVTWQNTIGTFVMSWVSPLGRSGAEYAFLLFISRACFSGSTRPQIDPISRAFSREVDTRSASRENEL